jgi:flagellar basal-body rod protein FlgF
MADGIYSALSGVMTNMQQIEVISHNMANISTPSFKIERTASQAVAPAAGANGELTFAMPTASVTDLSQGPLMSTDNPLDVAFTEGVYLAVRDNGQTSYVRSTTLSALPNGTLTDDLGRPVFTEGKGEGEENVIKIPDGTKEITISSDGSVEADGNLVGRLRLVSFQDEQALISGGNKLFIDPGGANAIPPENAAPVMAGYREQANFSAVKQMTDMIAAHRTYDITMSAVRTFGQIEKRGANNIASK